MTPDFVITIGRQALEICILILGVVLLPVLGVGLLISMFQAATQINEMTLSFVPKLLVAFLILLMAGSWILNLLVDFTTRLIGNIPSYLF